MDMTIRAATPAERLYTMGQSTQIAGQTGYVGHLRADMGADGQSFFKTWSSYRQDMDTEEFQQEFESVLNALVGDEQYGAFLKSGADLGGFCLEHPESSFNDGFAFGFRADTTQYSYLIRLQPYKADEHAFIYCYRRDWLDRHMAQAEKGIRFITPGYKEKFRIPDGDSVRIITREHDFFDHKARYIDDYHVEIGSNLYHICEFAERLERGGSKVIPLRSTLPEKCFSITATADEVIIITKGEMGYRLAGAKPEGVTPREGATAANEAMGVTKAQEAAMLAGSMFGWCVPAADPKNYDEQGQPIKPRHRDRGDAR